VASGYEIGRHFLKRRALAFLEDAKSDFARGEHDLALFHVEQFMQLYLKLGDFPKTHSPSDLFRLLASAYERESVMDFYCRNLE